MDRLPMPYATMNLDPAWPKGARLFASSAFGRRAFAVLLAFPTIVVKVDGGCARNGSLRGTTVGRTNEGTHGLSRFGNGSRRTVDLE